MHIDIGCWSASNYRAFLGAFQFLNINIFSIVMPVCLHSSWRWEIGLGFLLGTVTIKIRMNGYDEFLLSNIFPVALMMCLWLYYRVRRPKDPQGQRAFAAGCYRNVAFIVFLFYPSASVNTFRLLRPCSTVCLDMEETDCTDYLSRDYR